MDREALLRFSKEELVAIILAQHARWAWRARRSRRSGAMILGFAAPLIVTGYLLYYAGAETRNAASRLHQILGLMAPAGLVAHIALGRRRRVTAQTTDRAGLKDQVVGSPLVTRDESLASEHSRFSFAEVGAPSAKDKLRQP